MKEWYSADNIPDEFEEIIYWNTNYIYTPFRLGRQVNNSKCIQVNNNPFIYPIYWTRLNPSEINKPIQDAPEDEFIITESNIGLFHIGKYETNKYGNKAWIFLEGDYITDKIVMPMRCWGVLPNSPVRDDKDTIKDRFEIMDL